MVDERNERTRETDRTTIVTTGGGGGGGTVLAVLLVIILIGVVLLLLFGGWIGDSGTEIDLPDEVGVNVNVDQPGADTPDVPVSAPEAPAQDGNAG